MSDSLDTLVHSLEQWSTLQLKHTQHTTARGPLTPLPGDASARRYYRLYSQENKSYIVAHAPPTHEKNQAFITIAKDWLNQGVRTPVIFAFDIDQGFLLLEDFGFHTLSDTLKSATIKRATCYQQAMSILHRIQTIAPPKQLILPRFDTDFMQREMRLFNQWVADAMLKQPLTGEQQKAIDKVFALIADTALSQPYTLMHRDYHSRNLMPMANNSLGVLDFQDAVTGPATYDIASLLRDCYIDWPQSQVYQWLDEFSNYTPILKSTPKEQLYRWFDWMGLQRHLKVAGIFIRQWLDKGNTFYLQDLPRVFSYILYVCNRYPELQALHAWVEHTILPGLEKQPWWQPHQLSE